MASETESWGSGVYTCSGIYVCSGIYLPARGVARLPLWLLPFETLGEGVMEGQGFGTGEGGGHGVCSVPEPRPPNRQMLGVNSASLGDTVCLAVVGVVVGVE